MDTAPTDPAPPEQGAAKRQKLTGVPPAFPSLVDLHHTTGVWYWGPAGSGKKTAARRNFPDAYIKRPNGWWDDYAGQPYVIIEDIENYNQGQLLSIWSDRWSLGEDAHGDLYRGRPRKIIVTSKFTPGELFWDDIYMQRSIYYRYEIVKFPRIQDLCSLADKHVDDLMDQNSTTGEDVTATRRYFPFNCNSV